MQEPEAIGLRRALASWPQTQKFGQLGARRAHVTRVSPMVCFICNASCATVSQCRSTMSRALGYVASISRLLELELSSHAGSHAHWTLLKGSTVHTVYQHFLWREPSPRPVRPRYALYRLGRAAADCDWDCGVQHFFNRIKIHFHENMVRSSGKLSTTGQKLARVSAVAVSSRRRLSEVAVLPRDAIHR